MRGKICSSVQTGGAIAGACSASAIVSAQCMRTRNSNFPNNSPVTIPGRRNRGHAPNIVEPELRTIVEVAPMAERTMEELLRAPTEGMNTTSRESVSKTDERIDKLADQILTLVEIVSKKVVTPAPVKADEEICVTCSGPHAWYNCPNTDNNQSSVCAATGSYNQVNPLNRVSKQMAPPGFAPMQNNGQNRFNQNQGQGNSFNRGNNFIVIKVFKLQIIMHQIFKTKVQLLMLRIFKIKDFKTHLFKLIIIKFNKEFQMNFQLMQKANELLMRNLQSQINDLRGNFSKQEENFRRNLGNDMRSILGNFFQNQTSTSGTLPSNTIPNPKGEMKAITTRSGVAYEGPSIPTNLSPKKVVEQETEETTDKEQNNFQGSTAHIPPLVNPIPIPEPDVLKTLPKPNIPYPSRRNDQKSRDKASNQMEKIFQIFQDLRFDISFADALLLMPRFAPTIKNLLMNKEKLLELAKIQLNENCSAMLLKKLPEKLGDPGKFLIPFDFPGMDVCHALADLSASINLMPLSIWKKLSLPELTPTRMTLELVDRSITHPKGLAEDVFVKVGKFHFPTDFVVVDFEADPRVPLILGKSFLRTGRALIDVYGEEITLRVNDEAVTFNLNQTTRYSSTYDDSSINQIDVIDVACEEFSQEVLSFLNNSSGGNPTPFSYPILSSTTPSLTPFEGGYFILEEIETFLQTPNEFTDLDDDFYDTEGDILYLEQLLNEDPSLTLPLKKNEDLKQSEVTKAKPSIEEPPELELKDLPSHLEYAYLEENDKLPVIIAKGLKDDEKEALLKVLKSHKRAIAWKITDIKGIDPRFCTHKILMEDDYKPTVQSQRRVNPKIHEVIKKEVLKLLDAGMIYPISDSPWVSPVHCVLKNGGITLLPPIEENELIPTRLVTGWRVCIDYRKLNEVTQKDHFPLPFMDQMLERLAGNEFYCFLDGFSGYFQIPIDPIDQEKTTFTCPYGNYFGVPSHAMLPIIEGIVLGHKISKSGIEVDRAKVDVIAKLPHPTTVKGVRSFLGHAGFYRRFIQDFSKIARPMTHLLEKETPFVFSKDCIDAFETLKKKLTEAPILVVPDWNLPFELMCDASDFAIGAVLGQRKMKHFQPIHYASKTMTEAQIHYTTMEK
ncbi:reverse transcriptase domain-containing protein [Tanacetum coccineum]